MEEKEEVHVFCYRYMWTKKNDNGDMPEKVNVKFVTDVPEGLELFEKQVISSCGDTLLHFGREYVCEYAVSRIGIFEQLYNPEDL